MKFEHYQLLCKDLFAKKDENDNPLAKYNNLDVRALPALVLAYVGDAYFSLFVRTKLLAFEQNKVRVLHDFDAKIVSAVMQSYALHILESELSADEIAVVKRGRNTKSSVPKSASVSEYKYSTGFEALLGFLFLSGASERVFYLAEKSFNIISGKLTNTGENHGGKK